MHRYLILFCLIAASAGAQEWTRFRGPNGSGVSAATTIPAKWTEADYNWKVTLPGKGHSSPVIWGEKIFLTTADPETGKRIVQCLKTSDGSELWKREYESKTFRQHADNSYASSTPALDKERVYVCWSTPEQFTVLALAHDGKEAWRRELGTFNSAHGSGSSPIVFEDMVVLNNDQENGQGFLTALDAKTGATRWKLDRQANSVAYSTPCVFQPKTGAAQLIFASRTHGVTSLDPRTGKVNWELGDLFDKRVVASPFVASALVFAHCGEGPTGKMLVAIQPDTTTAKLSYKLTQYIPYVPTPVAKGDLLFLWHDQGQVTCIRASTGEQVWQDRPGGHFYGSPVCVGDRLYCMSTQGDIVVLAASDKYQLLARMPVGETTQATPAIAGGVMYLRTASHLISIGGKK